MARLLLLICSCVCAAIICAKTIPETQEDRAKRSSVCYGDLGCFSTSGHFTSLYRPISITPQSPQKINARFILHTRASQSDSAVHFLVANNVAGLKSSTFDASKPTKVISHGFLENGFVDWMAQMKNELLKHGDYNVILLDWGGGSGVPYTQATANTRVVGAELAKLIRVLGETKGARPEDFHLIGHSLGAHICGYAGARTQNLGRITGLDPADPYFQYTDPEVRLDPTDATFVDVMHTDGASILKLGYGMKQPCGHVDYFPNEGLVQPGCDQGPIDTIRTEGDIYNGAKEFVACSHLRAYKYFTESINSQCPFNGYRCRDYADFKRGLCMPCGSGGCGFMGFHADRAKPAPGQANVQYFLNTGDNAPFCRYHYQVDVSFGHLAGAKPETGLLFMNIKGSNGQLGEQQVTADPVQIQPGHTYGYVLTSLHDLGDITEFDFRWQVDSHWYNPLSWSILTHHTMHIDTVKVVNGETSTEKKICGFSAAIDSDVAKSFTSTC